MPNVIVTSGDLRGAYQIIRPISFRISNIGYLSSMFSNYRKHYFEEVYSLKKQGAVTEDLLYAEWILGQNEYEAAFFIATEELKKRAEMLGANAIIYFRQNTDLDSETNGFCLYLYGTAVRLS